jgi:phospholipase C
MLFAAAVLSLTWPSTGEAAGTATGLVPRYDHIIVIVEENQSYEGIMHSGRAPNIARLAQGYGSATQFYSEVHPSQANYVALLGGDTFGIHDDDAYYCRPGVRDPFCPQANTRGYVPHTIDAASLASQLAAVGYTWRGYFEDLPVGNLKAVTSEGDDTQPAGLYVVRHNPFLNFRSVQQDPPLAEELLPLERLAPDLQSGLFPAFALLIPNLCHEMHGLQGPNVPTDCAGSALVTQGDNFVNGLVTQIQQSPIWKAPGRTAIVITWDEDDGSTRGQQGCCGSDSNSPANFGGGHIPTVVITNYGPRGVADPTPYNHYSLLRTIEDAFGICEHLGYAGDDAAGVVPMRPLF